MSLIIQPKRRSIKPPLGVQINWGHPLANGLQNCWLLNEFGGSITLDLVRQQNGAFTAVNPVWNIANEPGLQSDSATNQGVTLPTGQINNVLNGSAWSMAVRFTPKATGGTKSNQFGGPGSNSSRCLMFDWQTSGKVTVGEENFAFIITAGTLSAGVVYDCVWTVNGTSHTLYINGQVAGTATYTFTGTYAGAYVLSSAGAGSSSDSTIHRVLLYNRTLTASEVQALYLDPYGFIQPQSPQRRFWVSAAATPSPYKQSLPMLGVG